MGKNKGEKSGNSRKKRPDEGRKMEDWKVLEGGE